MDDMDEVRKFLSLNAFMTGGRGLTAESLYETVPFLP